MKLPILRGVVRRCLLVNFRVDPDVMRAILPQPFEPSLHEEWAVAGICLIRLEQVPAPLVPFGRGLGSENAAHRVAVRWADGDRIHEGVYVHRSHTDSLLGHLAGSTVFPGEQRRARFKVADDGRRIGLSMRSADGRMAMEIEGRATAAMPSGSIFSSIRDASAFFERGSLGYAPGRGGRGYEGVMSETRDWAVHPLAVHRLSSSFFEDESLFPEDSVEFDHALVMRDVEHVWREAPELSRQGPRAVSDRPY
jgi:hypothetical protein